MPFKRMKKFIFGKNALYFIIFPNFEIVWFSARKAHNEGEKDISK